MIISIIIFIIIITVAMGIFVHSATRVLVKSGIDAWQEGLGVQSTFQFIQKV